MILIIFFLLKKINTLIRNSQQILKNYLNGWLVFDLITSVPIFSLITFLKNKSTKDEQLFHSHYYNTNLNNLHFLLAFFKVIKIFKVFNCNNSLEKLEIILNENEFINDWGNVFLFLFFL